MGQKTKKLHKKASNNEIIIKDNFDLIGKDAFVSLALDALDVVKQIREAKNPNKSKH